MFNYLMAYIICVVFWGFKCWVFDDAFTFKWPTILFMLAIAFHLLNA